MYKEPKAMWVTQGIRISSKNVRFFNKIINRLLLSKDARLYIAKYNKIYRKVIKEAKKRENDRFLLQATNKHKAMWQVINKELGKSTTKKQDITIDIGSTEIVDPRVITELFNAHFCEAPGKLLNKCKLDDIKIFDNPYFHLNSSTKSLFLTPITELELVKVAKGLKNKLASGVDDIPDLVIKKCIDVLKEPLTHIFNSSLEAGAFPELLKVTKVITFHKKGSTRNISNYRPIASLSIFSKLLEKLMYNRIIAFIDRNGILSDAQHGFR
jgi:hypothetical protein